MKLSKKELINIAETIHSFDWLCECDCLVEPYHRYIEKHPSFASLSKQSQKILIAYLWAEKLLH